MTCIFGSPDQWASVQEIAPEKIELIANYERQFELTIHRTDSVGTRAAAGAPYQGVRRLSEHYRQAMSRHYNMPIKPEVWVLPPGAFGESTGPT